MSTVDLPLDHDLFILELDDADLVDSGQVEAALRRLCLSPWSQRPRPNRLELECIQLASHGSVKTQVMSRRFKPRDAFTQRFLHEARQARHLGPELRSVGHALSVVGSRGLRRCLLEASVRRSVFCRVAPDEPLWDLFKHTIAVGLVARALASDFQLDSEDVSDAALFHDAGRAVASHQAASDGGPLTLDNADEVAFGLDAVRAELTLQCAENWRLGDGAHAILVDLHRSRSASDLHPGVALVVLAEELTFRLGFEVRRVVGVAAHHPMSGSSLSWARRALGIGTAMGTIERRAADVLRALAHMT